ncbi:winged helix-turn-helix domain-containing protein [Candidatus Woesearchaeota archaeon]|nr:winged helix-turn-helix domain-containing protein [Candidatus Woesearchaeota archaeon]
MKRIEQVYNKILEEAIENKNYKLTQKSLSEELKISLSTVNYAIKPLRNMGAIKVNLKNFDMINIKKMLYYWASIRNIEKDIIYRTRINNGVGEIEKQMPNSVIFTAYSAYKLKFKDMPSDYSEVYVYADINDIKNRFKQNKEIPNLFVLKKDISKLTLANLYVDLWNLKEWYSKEYLQALEKRLNLN